MENILISACLLGCACRYDGKEKKNESILQLMDKKEIHLIPICPEQLGGLPTPRIPSERKGKQVFNKAGIEVTEQYQKGAKEALKIAEFFQCKKAILKEKSPSCGSGFIYDGSFSKTLISGDGVTTELLKENGIVVFGESNLNGLFEIERKEKG